jgi:cell division septation protein DedD
MADPETPDASGTPAGGSVRNALYCAALGSTHAGHYLPAFARFDERGRAGPVWNPSAFVFHLGWLLYRQLWGAAGEFALLLAAWAAIGGGLWWVTDAWPLGVRVGLVLALLLLVLLVPGLFGTALLHAQVRQRMISAVEQSTTIDAACELLQSRGHRQQRNGAWAVAGLLVGSGAMAWALWAWMATPADRPAPLEATPSQPAASVPVPPPQTPALVAAPSPVASEPPESTPAVAEVIPAEPVSTSPTTAPLAEPAQTAAPAASVATLADVRTRIQGFGVSVGLFAVASNADRVVATLTGSGLPVIIDPIESARGPMTRVRVGPFQTRDEAQAAAERVRALGLEARVYAP